MAEIRWVIGICGLLWSVAVCAYNARSIILQIRGLHAPSWIPLLGGVSGAMALLILPHPSFAAMWWLPLFLDYGSIPGLTHTLIWHLWR